MFRRVNKGLTIIEVLIVLAVSSALAVISVTAFSTRGRTADDDAARQIFADIASVRNQAQQSQGPTTDLGKASLISESELFGQAIELTQDGANMEVKKLAKKTSDNTIYVYETYTIVNPSMLAWNVSNGLLTTVDEACDGSTNKNQFLSCYQEPNDGILKPFRFSVNSYIKNIQSSASPVIKPVLVFKNGTGESYILTSCQGVGCTIGELNMNSYLVEGSYTTTQQRKLRIGLAKKGSTLPSNTKAPQYYINFNLSIPNNQELQVVK